MKKEEGITLVALMITIIILIILAAVTILSVTNHNIIGKAERGAEEYAKGQEYELGEMNNVAKILGDFENKMAGENEEEETPSKITFTLSSEGVINDASLKKYDGTFEVESGTTWEEFFHVNFPDEMFGWLYKKSNGEILRFLEASSTNEKAYFSSLVNEVATKQYKENKIKSRYIFITWRWYNTRFWLWRHVFRN